MIKLCMMLMLSTDQFRAGLLREYHLQVEVLALPLEVLCGNKTQTHVYSGQ